MTVDEVWRGWRCPRLPAGCFEHCTLKFIQLFCFKKTTAFSIEGQRGDANVRGESRSQYRWAVLRLTPILGTPPCSPKSPPPCLSAPLSHSLGLARRKEFPVSPGSAKLSPTMLTQSQLPPPLPTILHGLLSLRSKVMSSQQPPGPAGSLLSVLPPPPPIPLPLSPFFLSLLPFLPSLLLSSLPFLRP